MKSDKVAAAKRILSRMDKGELKTIGEYLRKRWELLQGLENRARDAAKIKASWERIANLPVGAAVRVNLQGDKQFPRGTMFEIESFNARGRKSVHLKGQDKSWTFSDRNVNRFDIIPADDYDPKAFPRVTQF